MNALVVDTDVISFVLKQDTRASAFVDRMAGYHLVVSFQTVAELQRWAILRAWGARRRSAMEHFLGSFRIHLPRPATCERWAQASSAAVRAGRPIATADAWIAATALELRAPLVTNNRRHFESVDGIELL